LQAGLYVMVGLLALGAILLVANRLPARQSAQSSQPAQPARA
jgi:hypothetical protein